MKMKARQKAPHPETERTQDKILHAATKVFAEHGYRDATTRMICREAQVNVALVNYYFRSKADLYKAVVAALFEGTGKPLIALADTVVDKKSWELALRTWVRRSLAICAAEKPPELWTARLLGREECEPSELTLDIEEKFAKPVRECFARLIRMGMRADDPVQECLWTSSVNAQCAIYALTRNSWGARFCRPNIEMEDWLDKVAQHICAGIFAQLSFQRKV